MDKSRKKLSNYLTIHITIIVTISTISFGIIASIITAIIQSLNLNLRHINSFAVLIIIFCFSSLVAVIISYFIIKFYTRSIDEIKIALDKVAEGDYSASLILPPKKKVIKYEVYNEFNKMIDELKKNAILKGEFVSNFSHEFKTPITSIKGYAELLQDDSLSKEERDKYLNIIILEAERLKELSNQTLLLNKLDASNIITNVTSFDISDLAMECVLLLDGELKNKNINVDFKTSECYIRANRDLIKEVIINLLTNAIKYGREDGNIEIITYAESSSIYLSVRDDGIGMDENNCEHIFDRYYQIDKSHSSKGIGLGLSIVKKIMEASDGSVSVKSVEGKGSIFTIKFNK